MLTVGYRADGQRAWKQTAAGRTYYVYDGDKLLYEMNASGSITAKNTWGLTGLLARATPARTLLYTWDAQGNVSQQLDASTGSIVSSYMFDAFGSRSVNSSDPTAPNEPYSGFGGSQGYYADVETGLQLLGHRYYDPGTGRFLTRDPISYAGGINLYEAVCNSPLGMHDASGLFSIGPIEIPDPEAMLECLSTMLKIGIQMGNGSSPCSNEQQCQALGNCLADSMQSACKFWLTGLLIELGPEAPIFAGCICGAIEGALHYAVDTLCSQGYSGGCHPRDINIGCLLTSMLGGTLSGCLGGGLGDSALALIAKLLASVGLDLGADAVCDTATEPK